MNPITGCETPQGERAKAGPDRSPGGGLPAVRVSVLLLSCAWLLSCEDMRADRAYVHGDYGSAVKELRDLAEHGEARAQYDLGLLYDKGQGVAKNDQQAFYWYRKAAEQGEARAQYNLGLLYAEGQGVAQDYVEAYVWLRLAAEQGERQAPNALEYVAGRMTSEQTAQAKTVLQERLERKRAQTCWYCELFHRGAPP